MLSKADALEALRALFKKKRLLMLPDIYSLLGTSSRMSAFRRLRELNYLSSFSHVGRYYTLPTLAHFDPQGLWFYEGVGFSRFGNLKQTVIHLVDQSVAGKTHEELEKQLHLRVHNTLLDLVRSGKIVRESFEDVFLYLSNRADRAQHLSRSPMHLELADRRQIRLAEDLDRILVARSRRPCGDS